MLIGKSEATTVFSRIIEPVVAEFGYRATRNRKGDRRSTPVQWEMQIDDFVLRVHLQRGKTGRRYYVNLNLYLKVKEGQRNVKSRNAILLGRLEEIPSKLDARRVLEALDTEKSFTENERKKIITAALREYGLPTLAALADRQAVTEAYLCGVMLIDGRRFGILQPHAREFFEPGNGMYLHIFDLPTLEDSSIRMTDDCLRRGRVSILIVWTVRDAACRKSHPQIIALKASSDIDVYGLVDRDSPEAVSAFLESTQNPYSLCGVDLDGMGTRSPDGRRPIDWGRIELPLLMVVDGNGVVRNMHYGEITKDTINKELISEIEEAKKPYEYIPLRAREIRA